MAILEFFALGTWGFWLLIAITSIVITALVENDRRIFPGFILASLAAAYFKDLTLLGWQSLSLGVLGYCLIGAIWSFYRWHRYTSFTADSFSRTYGTQLTESRYADLSDCLSVAENKGCITTWIAYWPWSLIWNIFGDVLTAIFDSLRSIYRGIATRKLKQFTKVPATR